MIRTEQLEQAFEENQGASGWDWFETKTAETIDSDELARVFARCLAKGDGDVALRHLRQTFLDRRMGPNASDAELRFLEGQRSVVAYILSMIQRGS